MIIILLTSGYGAFATRSFTHYSLVVPNPLTNNTTFLERTFKSNTLPLYEFIIRKLCGIKIRDMGFQVSPKQIQQIKPILEPGDIILLRKNNYISNWVIKGFWKHALLYCGSLNEMENYFSNESKTVLGSPIKDYLFRQMRPSYDKLSKNVEFQEGAVIESISKGVILQTMDKALLSDYLAVLRPKLPKKNKLSAILYSLEQLEKPYDYLFDFIDDAAFSCTELIYKAFYPHNGVGLTHDLYMLNGRPVVSPNDFAKDFDHTYFSADCQYDLIRYVGKGRGSNESIEKNTALFRNSWKKKSGI